MEVLLGATMTNSNPETEAKAPSVPDTPGPGELGWSLHFSQEGLSWPLYSNAAQGEEEVPGFFFPGDTQNFVHWWQQSAEQLSAQVDALEWKQQGSLISEAGQSHGVIPI